MHEGHRGRLRERYLQNGLDGFADHEILELLLTYCIPRRNTNDIAHALLKRFGSIDQVFAADIKSLSTVPNIGENTAIFLRLIGQVTRRLFSALQWPAVERSRLSNPLIAAAFAIETMREERYESVYVVSLDKNLRLLHAERLLSGTLTEAPLYPRRVVESALVNRAHSVMLMHNHPSGDPEPSQSDLHATEVIKRALQAIDMQLFDHLIVGANRVYSCMRGIVIEPPQNANEPPNVIQPSGNWIDSDPALLAAEKKQ